VDETADKLDSLMEMTFEHLQWRVDAGREGPGRQGSARTAAGAAALSSAGSCAATACFADAVLYMAAGQGSQPMWGCWHVHCLLLMHPLCIRGWAAPSDVIIVSALCHPYGWAAASETKLLGTLPGDGAHFHALLPCCDLLCPALPCPATASSLIPYLPGGQASWGRHGRQCCCHLSAPCCTPTAASSLSICCSSWR
jgi:hypothetical protein